MQPDNYHIVFFRANNRLSNHWETDAECLEQKSVYHDGIQCFRWYSSQPFILVCIQCLELMHI